MANKIQVRRGLVASLPTNADIGEPLWATDAGSNGTLYIGDGTTVPTKVAMSGDIVNADISSSAAIARSKIAASTASTVVINDGSGNLSAVASLTVPNGGTGLATLTSANLLVGAGTGSVTFIAPGTSGNVLTSNGSTWASTTPVAELTKSGALTSDDAGRTSTTTLTSIGSLTLSQTWAVTSAYIVLGYFSVVNSNAAPDCDFQFNGPSTSTISLWYHTIRSTSITLAPTEITTFVTGGTAGNNLDLNAGGVTHVYINGSFLTAGTPGTNPFALEYAQAVSGATATIIQRGSYLKVTKVG